MLSSDHVIDLTFILLVVPVLTIQFHAVRGTWGQRQNSHTRSIQEIYDEEVDEETKLRHKIDEVGEIIQMNFSFTGFSVLTSKNVRGGVEGGGGKKFPIFGQLHIISGQRCGL